MKKSTRERLINLAQRSSAGPPAEKAWSWSRRYYAGIQRTMVLVLSWRGLSG